MGTRDESNTVKSSQPSSSPQEASTMPAYPDWSSSMQAYYGAGAAPPFFAATVASPTPHPYMWAGQHPLMPPYGTPVPYPALYPHGGVYAHPNMTVTPVTAPAQAQVASESEGKGSKSKEKATSKRSRDTSLDPSRDDGKARETGVKAGGESGSAASGSGNDGATQSAESGGDGSSDASENDNHHDYATTKKGRFNQMLVEGANAQNNNSTAYHTPVSGNPVVSIPGTNLNMGMDLWSAPSAVSGALKMLPNSSGRPAGMMGDQWIQDERELKRQKRKQSNRESARRSRLRKQAECEELQHKVENLSTENRTLRDELERLSEECEKLTSQNNSIKEELVSLCGPDAIAKL